MYMGLSLALTGAALVEYFGKFSEKTKTRLFFVLAAILTALLTFRWGQGSDYFNYLDWRYLRMASMESIADWNFLSKEGGFFLFVFIMQRLHVPFEVIVAIISLVTMVCTIHVIYKYSPLKCMSLLLLYPTYYMTYYFSAFQQGLAVVLFLAFGIPILQKRKWVAYYVFCVFDLWIHTVGVTLFVIPIFMLFYEKMKWFRRALPALVVVGLLTIYTFNPWISEIVPELHISSSYSWMALLLRTILFTIIAVLYFSEGREGKDETDRLLYIVYLCGFAIYVVTFVNRLSSQRLSMPCKMPEVILLPRLFAHVDTMEWRKPLAIVQGRMQIWKRTISVGACTVLLLALMMNVEGYKNIVSYIDQGGYHEELNAFTYPYITVFNKEDMWEYRELTEGTADRLERYEKVMSGNL